MSSLSAEQQLLHIIIRVSAPGAWELSFPDSGRPGDINIIKRGSGNTTTGFGLTGAGTHTVFLIEGGRVSAQASWTEQKVVYVSPPPPPAPPPPLTSPPIIEQPNPQGEGYWKVGAASPNDSSSRFVGSKFGSSADCVRAWQSIGYAGTGGCAWVQTKAPTSGIEAFASWAKDALNGMQESVSAQAKALTGVMSRLQALEDFLKDFWPKLEGWLVERLVGLMLRALDGEVEGAKK